MSTMLGDAPSFQVMSERVVSLVQSTSASSSTSIPSITPLIVRIRRNADFLLARRDVVLLSHEALRAIRMDSSDLLNEAQSVAHDELVADLPPPRIAATSQLLMLTQRIGKSAAELISFEGLNPEAVFLLRKDTETFQVLVSALRDGNPELRLRPARTAVAKERLGGLLKRFGGTKEQVDRVLSTLRDLVAVREAQAHLLIDVEALDAALQPLCFVRE